MVASEVRGLAQRSAEAAKEIKALVATATAEVNGGVDLVSATGEALARIGAKVTQMNGVVSEVLSSARQQASSLGEIRTAVGELSSATQQNAAMAEESTAVGRSLARDTGVLSNLVAQFKLGGGGPAPIRRAAPPSAPRPSLPAPRRAGPPAGCVGGRRRRLKRVLKRGFKRQRVHWQGWRRSARPKCRVSLPGVSARPKRRRPDRT